MEPKRTLRYVEIAHPEAKGDALGAHTIQPNALTRLEDIEAHTLAANAVMADKF
ncbi:hypothetical protein [Adhaeretor mobilis]|uniref:hypothetical protein n=1 Tax=Adhaeretor mobilis TaxID=1930276 RepID=UPI001C54E7C8|nr:hypothetical protein [Adhaeretor mobilis]